MAIWQTCYNVIPRELYQYSESIEINLYEYEWSDIFYLNKDLFFNRLDTFIERSWSMRRFQSWGQSDKSDIGVTYDLDKNVIVHIRFRLDLREDVKDFLMSFLSICKEFDLLILDQYKNVFEPEIEAFKDSIEKSNALKFVTDPKMFIEDFSNGKIKDEE